VAAAAEQREGRDLYLVIASIEAVHADPSMDRSSLAQRDDERCLVVRNSVVVRVAEREDLASLLERQLANIVEALAQEPLCGLVEKEQVAVLVGEEHRDGEAVGELPHQDQAYVALRHRADCHSRRDGILLSVDTDLPDELLDPQVVGGLSEHILDGETPICTSCGAPLGYSGDDQPFWPTGPLCANCYQARQMDDELAWSDDT
jgi:hypothetical protein